MSAIAERLGLHLTAEGADSAARISEGFVAAELVQLLRGAALEVSHDMHGTSWTCADGTR